MHERMQRQRQLRSSCDAGSAGKSFSTRNTLIHPSNHCRRALATSQYLTNHKPSNSASPQTCSHHFLDPLSWMREELEQGKLEGRLECPKCRTNVGKYAWQGMRCSCGEWVVPGISLAKGRLDEHKIFTGKPQSMGIRQPAANPGQAKGTSQGNL